MKMGKIMDSLAFVDGMVLKALKVVTIVVFVFLTILITANVIVRFFPVVSLHWFDEIIELLYAYLVFYGSAAIWITGEHFSVGDWIGGRVIKKEQYRHVYRLVLGLLSLAFVSAMFYYSLRLTIMAKDV